MMRKHIQSIVSQWIILLTATIIASAVAGLTYSLRPPEYTATLTLYVSAQTGDTPQAAFQGAQLSQQRVTSYVELVASQRIATSVVQQLALPMTSQELTSRISASSALDSVLIDIAARGPTPTQAAEIANAVGQSMTELVAEIERPTDPRATAPVEVRIVQTASIPQTPSSLSLVSTLIGGALLGFVLGAGLALVRQQLDTSVRTTEELRTVTGKANLGVTSFDARVQSSPLVVNETPNSPLAESFRQIRTNLRFMNIDSDRRVLAITSSVPGEGKSTTTANLALAVSATGARTLVVEADLRKPALSQIFGLDNSIGLTSVLTGQVSRSNAIQSWNGTLDVLASGNLPPNPSELLASQQMIRLIHDLRSSYDVVLLDTPPLVPVADAAALAPMTDGIILLVRAGATSKAQIETSIQALRNVSANIMGTVFSMVSKRNNAANTYYGTYAQTQRHNWANR